MGRFLKVFFKTMVHLLWVSVVIGVVGAVGAYFYFSKDLPVITTLEEYNPPVVTTIYSDDGRKIAELFDERRFVIEMSDMSASLIDAFIAAEDARFYEHEGIDIVSILRAFVKNMEAGTVVQGGSTITQQVAKSFFLTPERSYSRKIKEAILAYRIDRYFEKDEILYLYMNQIYLGNGAYGVEAASRRYFNKSAKEATLAESALLAGLTSAPSRYSPNNHPARAKSRQIYVLNRMAAHGFITEKEAEDAINDTVEIAPRQHFYTEKVPYYAEHVRRVVEGMYGRDMLYRGGLDIYTNVDIEMQEAARKAVTKGLRDLDKRQGYRGPLGHLEGKEIEDFSRSHQQTLDSDPLEEDALTKGVVIQVDDSEKMVRVRIGNDVGSLALEDMRWARKPDPDVPYGSNFVQKPGDVLRPGDVIEVRIKGKNDSEDSEDEDWHLALEQTPEVQSALLSMEPDTGRVKSMLGGRNFSTSQFNRAFQARRQPGSAFKPIIYAAAIDRGYTPATTIADTPVVYEDVEQDFTWKPRNYDGTFHGFTLLRDGLIHSRNVITVKLLQDIGIPYLVDYARKLGIESPLARDLSLSLGSSGVSLVEIVGAYSVFANQGEKVAPQFINRIEDRRGNVIYIEELPSEQVIDESTAYIITHLMEQVIEEGTGWRLKALNRPAAGKTGTTNDLQDAWFIGYTPEYVTGVWVGMDDNKTLGARETGSRAAAPIWLDYNQSVLEDKPKRFFPVPNSVVFAKIDADTGLLPIDQSRKVIYECFKEGTVPTERTRNPNSVTEAEEFFRRGIE